MFEQFKYRFYIGIDSVRISISFIIFYLIRFENWFFPIRIALLKRCIYLEVYSRRHNFNYAQNGRNLSEIIVGEIRPWKDFVFNFQFSRLSHPSYSLFFALADIGSTSRREELENKAKFLSNVKLFRKLAHFANNQKCFPHAKRPCFLRNSRNKLPAKWRLRSRLEKHGTECN